MRAVDAATRIGSPAFPVGRRLAPPRIGGRGAIGRAALRHGLAALLAVFLLPASIHAAWAQLCVCAEPGWMNCALLGFQSHEPATAAFPQCMAQPSGPAASSRGGGESGGPGGGQRAFHRPKVRPPAAHVERPPTYPKPRERAPVASPTRPERPPTPPTAILPPAAPAAEPQSDYEPYKTPEIQPLPCPKGMTKVGETFYGGTQCGPAGEANPPPPAEPPKAGAGAGDSIGNAVKQDIPDAPSGEMKEAADRIRALINAQLRARGLPPLAEPPSVGATK